MRGGVDADGNAQYRRDQVGRECEHQRAWQPLGDQFADILFVGEGIAKLALGDDTAHPAEPLDMNRLIKAVLSANRLRLALGLLLADAVVEQIDFVATGEVAWW